MSIKTLALMAAVVAGTLAFNGRASAQVYYSSYYSPVGEYVYSSPFGYTSYYGYPNVGYTAFYDYPYYRAYYDYPYYGGYVYRRGLFGRRAYVGWW